MGGDTMDKFLSPEDDDLPMNNWGQWTEIKLFYLERYINIFETSMKDKWSTRNYIDLLAGSGKNTINNSKVILGSPLIALTTPYPFTHYYFVDIDKKNINSLITRCNHSQYNINLNIYWEDCNIIVDQIINSIKSSNVNSLNLAFLDPRGLELQWNTIKKLASTPKMDLIIYYPQMGLTRYIKTAYQSDAPTSVDNFFGTDEWRNIYQQCQNRSILNAELINLYRKQLQNIGYKYIFQGNEDLQSSPLITNTKRNPLYRLIFASKHTLGHDFWKKAILKDPYGQRHFDL